jgi:hypothetical protein
MATNNWNVTTDDYDIYAQGGDTVTTTPGSPVMNEDREIEMDPYYFPGPRNPSVMDPDPDNTGSTNDFWTHFPIVIDVNGYIFYNNENTGINIRGPAGVSTVHFDELTPAQKESLKGADGRDGSNGTNGVNGENGLDGLDAYHIWLRDNEYTEDEHPISEFYAYLGGLSNLLLKAGEGTGSLILNYNGNKNSADGAGSLASGFGTQTIGDFSFTTGYHTTAANNYQAVFGKFNNPMTNTILEIGNGNSDQQLSNALWLKNNGDLNVSGTITDGQGNILSNKVDKILGKGLSTNDFDNTYKAFIDNYTVDTSLSTASLNPVQNKVIAEAINNIQINGGRPTQERYFSDEFLGFMHPVSLTDGVVNTINYTDGLKWNPNKNILKLKYNTATGFYSIALGQGTTANFNNETVIGKYNNSVEGDLFEIGNGASSDNLSNAFRVTQSGDIIAGADVQDGLGNVLRNKQNTLTFDSEPTENSLNIVRSGDLYDYLTTHGINPEGGLDLPEVDLLKAQVTALTTRVATLEATVAALLNPREFIDDTYTYNTYLLGVDKGDLYIKLKEDESSQNNETGEEETGE